MDRGLIKETARAVLRGKWLMPLLVGLLVALATGTAAVVLPVLGGLLIGLPLTVSLSWYFVGIYRAHDPDLGVAFGCFENYLANFGAMIWASVFTFLWSLLFVIPGIIKSFSYAMTPYLIAEFPDALNYKTALQASMAMMRGHKWDYFVFFLSFILWFLLGAVTFGIAYIYVTPYVSTAAAGYYDMLCDNAIANGSLAEFGITRRVRT